MHREVGTAERLGIKIAPLQPEGQLPAVIPTAGSRMEMAKAAVQRITDAFEMVAARHDLHAARPVASFAYRHQKMVDLLGYGTIGVFVLSVGTALWNLEWAPLWGLVPAIAGFAASVSLESDLAEMKKDIENGDLDSANVAPIVAALQSSSAEDRALVRLFVEQKTSELEEAKRLTPAAALAMRQSIKGAVSNYDELDRVSRVAAFVAKHKTTGLAEVDLYALNTVLHAATPEERLAAADYIDSTLFPKERPLAHLNADLARKLYNALAYFRGADVPAPPTAPEAAAAPAA